MLKPGGTCILTQYIVPEGAMADARDEHFNESPAASFDILEEGDLRMILNMAGLDTFV
ncbi:hypothetical protein SAMN05444162_3548 [Paenibacillaceae bacterium GAS479]|nr:hypothetical protein SAMN05444162_3548 [Paenibacillaceae bacterium GAS479]